MSSNVCSSPLTEINRGDPLADYMVVYHGEEEQNKHVQTLGHHFTPSWTLSRLSCGSVQNDIEPVVLYFKGFLSIRRDQASLVLSLSSFEFLVLF